MTNLEVITGLIGSNYPYDENTFTTGLLLGGLVPTDDFIAGRASDIAIASFLLFLTTSAEKISEGGYTVEINIDALFKLRKVLLDRWGLPDGLSPRLINKTYLW